MDCFTSTVELLFVGYVGETSQCSACFISELLTCWTPKCNCPEHRRSWIMMQNYCNKGWKKP